MSAARDAILAQLNTAQREAVLHREGPLLVLAGAGSGKTRVITHRIAHLLHQGIPSESILAITFTNKAAGEMKDRTEKLCRLRSPWIATFHSFAARLLRRHIYRIEPYDTSFTICDPEDCLGLLKEVLKALQVDPGVWQARAVLSEISHLKSREEGDVDSLGADYRHGQVLRNIYLRYSEEMRRRNIVDFDDLLLLLVRLLKEHPDILARYRKQFQFVLIDEYQDTNALQYTIGRLLTADHCNICITGDPDQSIYSWRGADIRNILNFERDYPDARVVRLEQNYRSTGNILFVAGALIAHNLERKPKELWTENPAGDPVRVIRLVDEQDEARTVARQIREWLEAGLPAGGIAVFYRINALSRSLEQELIIENIPYSIVGGLEFFLRREIKDLIAYLRVLDNPRDSESLKRILNVPLRGIGKGSVERLSGIAAERQCGLLEVILKKELTGEVGGRAGRAVEGFRNLLEKLRDQRNSPVRDLLVSVIRLTGYEEHLRKSFPMDAEERLANIGELVNSAEEYDRSAGDGGLTGFLEITAILGDVDRWERSEDRVALMSLHAAKGLEFPAVIITGLEDGILPLIRASDTSSDIEEERRLFYVGITRAKEKLLITHAGCRRRFGSIQRNWPSRFLQELQPAGEDAMASFERLRMDMGTEESIFSPRPNRRGFGRWSSWDLEPPGADDYDGEGGTGEDPGWEDVDQDAGEVRQPSRSKPRVRRPLQGFDPDEGEPAPADETDPFPEGARVWHEDYGEGDVVHSSGQGWRRRITVRFDEAGDKQFILAFTDLRRVR
ncbi:MAG: UvrD-helicase domain-containing protein [Planctomycetes bacterium]|nr:UvrD-helicase domain-containing protein [Planctomycetota bacterium]